MTTPLYITSLLSHYPVDDNPPEKIAEGENTIYEFNIGGAAHMLRVTASTRRQEADLLAETEFIQYLNRSGGPAVTLVPAFNGARVVSAYAGGKSYYAFAYRVAQGSFPGGAAWGEDVFFQWGRTAGELHRLSRHFHPSETPRYQWFEDPDLVYVLNASGKKVVIAQRCRQIVDCLQTCPAGTENYGLIHNDLHPGNMCLKDGRITIFDFDDCQYSFFLYEAAVALFFSYWHPQMITGALQQNPADTDHAAAFLRAFFAGYQSQYPIYPGQLPYFQQMLKLQRCILWGVLDRDGDDLGEWAPLYAKWSHEIAEDTPFLNLDFTQFA